MDSLFCVVLSGKGANHFKYTTILSQQKMENILLQMREISYSLDSTNVVKIGLDLN
jgi:hypothetical protein